MTSGDSTQSNYKIFEPFLLAISMVIGMFLGYNLFDAKNDLSLLVTNEFDSNTLPSGGIGRIEEIIRIVENSYVDKVDSEEMSKDAIVSIVQQLDPHSSYISPQELEEYNQRMEGVYKGIGVESKFVDDSLFVNYVIPNSQAEKAGINPGDIILNIGSDTVSGRSKDHTFVESIIRSADSNTLSLQVKSKHEKIQNLNVELEEITAQSASSHYLIDGNHGYIKIKRFSANTYDQFFKSLESLSDLAKKDDFNLILDLRDNPGGFVPQTLRILSQLFNSKDKLLSYTIGEHRKRKEYKSTGRSFYNIQNIVILINENSASASEIIAGAIQDWDRGILLGERSYGKGLVQEIFPLKRGGAIRLTVARYATPSGRFIQTPYEIKNDEQLQEDSTFYTLKLKREIKNNGGILPDITIEQLEEDKYQSKATEFVCKHILPYYDKIELEYLQNESVSLPFLIDYSSIQERQLRAELIYSWYGEIPYYEYFQKRDPMLRKAVEILSKKDPLKSLASNEF